MKSSAKKISPKRAPAVSTTNTSVATAIPTLKKAKKDTTTSAVATPKKKQVNPATLPPLIDLYDITSVKTKMLSTTETTKARTTYEEFVNKLDLTQYPGQFDHVSFGDLLQVTPSLPTNKRKFESLLEVDTRVAAIYQEAQDTYKSLLDKTETAKITDYAKRKKLANKKPATAKKTETGDVVIQAESGSKTTEPSVQPAVDQIPATEEQTSQVQTQPDAQPPTQPSTEISQGQITEETPQ